MKTQSLKKIYKLIFITAMICMAMLLSNCNKEEIQSVPAIYMAGYVQNSDGIELPCYWKNNNTPVILDLLFGGYQNGHARAIQAVDNTVYTVGYNILLDEVDEANNFYAPCYWAGNTCVELPALEPTMPGKAEDIQVVGDVVFTAGFTTNNNGITVPCYWINREREDLQVLDPTKDGGARAIYIAKNALYTAGYTRDNNDVAVPCYWRNGTLVPLAVSDPTRGGVATDIYLVENDIYVSGYTIVQYDVNDDGTIDPEEGLVAPCYWKNGIRTDLSLYVQSYNSFTTAIGVKDDIIYTAGYGDILNLEIEPGVFIDIENFPSYWENNTINVLPILLSDAPEGRAYDIDVTENAIYISGYSIDDTGVSVPCYWENGVRTDLPTISFELDGKAFGIYVAEE